MSQPTTESATLKDAGGRLIGYSVTAPAAAVGDLVILGAMAAPHRFYRRFAEYLATEHSLRITTFDYPGVGASLTPPVRKETATASTWAMESAQAVVDHAAANAGNGPFGIVGHSFGGQILGMLHVPPTTQFASLIATQSGYWNAWSGWPRLRMLFLWFAAIPVATMVTGTLPGWMIGETMPSGVAREWARWGRHPEYIGSVLTAQQQDRYRSLPFPIELISFSDDSYAQKSAVDAIAPLYPAATTRRHFNPSDLSQAKMGHFGFFRSHTQLWDEIGRKFARPE